MRKVFWDNPYQTSLKTKVIQVEGNTVIFDETIGFSECGGQESDCITVDDFTVKSSYMNKKAPFIIYYVFSEDHNFIPGSEVTMKIDWSRRYR